MKKIPTLLVVCTLLFAACEDPYKANLDKVENLLVIEGLLTNSASSNYVKLSKTSNFYSNEGQQRVSGATVTISDSQGNTYALTEQSAGYFPIAFGAQSGRQYKIKVEAEGETYESDYELMPPVPDVDTAWAEPDTTVVYAYASDGMPMSTLLTGMSVYADLPQTADLKYFRLSMPRTLEWVVPPPEEMPTPPPVWCWNKFAQSGVFPIQGPSEYGSEAQLKKRKMLFLQNNIRNFVIDEKVDSGAYMVGWLVDLSLFGLSEKSYRFYESVNAQLEADGKLFDPVYAQLEPNIRCTSNDEKRVVGFFEVSSYRFRRFFVMAAIASKKPHFHWVDPAPAIPASGQLKRTNPPAFWQNVYSK